VQDFLERAASGMNLQLTKSFRLERLAAEITERTVRRFSNKRAVPPTAPNSRLPAWHRFGPACHQRRPGRNWGGAISGEWKPARHRVLQPADNLMRSPTASCRANLPACSVLEAEAVTDTRACVLILVK